MKKLLRPQDVLLLGLSNVLDLFEELKDPLGVVGKSYESMYGFVPSRYKKNNFNHLVWRSLKTGYIEKVVVNEIPCLRLTSAGEKRVERDFALFKVQNSKWDKKWRIVAFDIDEANKKTRDRFRYKLKELGFGMLQESIFITPNDIIKDFSEFVEAQGLDDYVYIMEVSNILGNIKNLVNRIWHLDKLNEQYLDLLSKIDDLTSFRGRGLELNNLQDKKEKEKEQSEAAKGESPKEKDVKVKSIKDIKNKYLEILLRDPFLPKKLLPENWAGEKVKSGIKKLGLAI